MGIIRHPATTRFVSLALLISLCVGAAGVRPARAQLLSGLTRTTSRTLTQTTQVVTQVVKLSPDLLQLVAGAPSGRRVRVVVQSGGVWGLTLDLLLLVLGARTTHVYRNINARAVDIPAGNVLTLAASALVSFVSTDRPVRLLGHLSATTGADAARVAAVTSSPTLDGSGVGVAVIDSGVYAGHRSFLDKSNRVRVTLSKDFTGENRTDDPYGHGTHVAALAAGGARVSNGAYAGVAPNANVINLRALDSRGAGTTAGLLAALDWVLTNRNAYNIRVVNMSLGAAAVDSYRDDPLCRAARKLVDSGVVVVAAAGNEGKDGAGQKVYGRVHSPGIEPSVITVGASNTFGTDARSDDALTTYSSRGPTRGFRVDVFGARHYDNLVKPELVAPGNKLVSAQSPGNLLVTTHPELDAGASSAESRRMMRLSGTSMATPAVAGAAALMLQANPRLTPNVVKMILMYTAQPLAGFNYFEQGMGQLNVEGAIRLAKLVRTDLSNSTPVRRAAPRRRAARAAHDRRLPHLHLVARPALRLHVRGRPRPRRQVSESLRPRLPLRRRRHHRRRQIPVGRSHHGRPRHDERGRHRWRRRPVLCGGRALRRRRRGRRGRPCLRRRGHQRRRRDNGRRRHHRRHADTRRRHGLDGSAGRRRQELLSGGHAPVRSLSRDPTHTTAYTMNHPERPGAGDAEAAACDRRRLAFRLTVIALGAIAAAPVAWLLPVERLDVGFLLLALLTVAVSSRVAVRIPHTTGRITVADTFILLTLLLYGGEAAALLAAAEGVCSSLRISRKALTVLFNAAVMICSTYATALVLRVACGPAEEALVAGHASSLVTLVCLMGLAQYVFNAGLVAFDKALKLERGFVRTWREFYLWASLTYFAGAAAAGVLARLVVTYGFYPVAAAAPVVAIVYLTYQTYLKSVEAADAQAAMAESHVQELNRYLAEQERISRELEESREHFRNAALHDALTGLPNRSLLMSHLKLAVEHAKRRPGYLFAVLFLDLDRFKVINDSLGHVAGDQLLVQLARRLEECIRSTDTVARLGGDEFASS